MEYSYCTDRKNLKTNIRSQRWKHGNKISEHEKNSKIISGIEEMSDHETLKGNCLKITRNLNSEIKEEEIWLCETLGNKDNLIIKVLLY